MYKENPERGAGREWEHSLVKYSVIHMGSIFAATQLRLRELDNLILIYILNVDRTQYRTQFLEFTNS